MRLAVSLGFWQDRPPEEALDTAVAAEEHGYPELWIGEMATWDAFALATAVGTRTSRIGLTVGPLAVSVRDPAMIAMGIASVAALAGRGAAVALGTSSDVLVRDWHGRSRRCAGTALAESAAAVRAMLHGETSALDGAVLRSVGYRLRLSAPRAPLTVAAFGPAAIDTAARYADRMVLNLLSPAMAARLVTRLRSAAAAAGRGVPSVAVWVPAAVDPDTGALEQLRRAVVGYLAAPGYADMFRAEGFGEVVDLATGSRPHPRELLAAVPPELVASVSLLGSATDVAGRLGAYAEAGVDEVVLVPGCTARDPAGAATLRALAGLRTGA